MNSSLFQLSLIHFREFIREPGILFWSIIFPVLMAWVLGVAFSREPESFQTIALVNDGSPHHSNIQSFLDSAKQLQFNSLPAYQREINDSVLGKLIFRFVPTKWDSAILLLKRGQVNIIINERGDSLKYHFDPRNPDAKLGYMQLSTWIEKGTLVNTSGEIRSLQSVGTRYIDFLLPGLLAMGLMNSIVWGICYGLIEMRVKKLLRRMVATPMKRSEFLISLFLARFSLSIIEALILFFFSKFFFNITIEGSIVALMLVFLSGNIAFGGISILLAARVENTRIGNGMINLIVMPMTVLSGIFFSYQNFPEIAVSVIKMLPLTMLADSMRSIFIEGAGLFDVMPTVLILSGLGFSFFIIGLKIFKWY